MPSQPSQTPQQTQKPSHPPRLALVLGGGGSRGIAHIGVLDVLHQAGVPIDLIVGTSMGAIVGAMYSTGQDTQTMAENLEQLSGINLLNINLFSQRARQRRIREELNRSLQGMTFADLNIPLAVTAVDMKSGREIVLNEGNLVRALLASSAVPGVFPPVHLDGMELADGGVIDSVATHVAFSYNSQIVIAVDVYPPLDESNPWTDPLSAIMGMNIPLMSSTLPWSTSPNPVTSLWRSVRVMTWHLHQERLKAHPPHVLLRPPVGSTGSLDFSDTQGPYFAGVQEAQEHLGEILAQVDQLSQVDQLAQGDQLEASDQPDPHPPHTDASSDTGHAKSSA